MNLKNRLIYDRILVLFTWWFIISALIERILVILNPHLIWYITNGYFLAIFVSAILLRIAFHIGGVDVYTKEER
jgi:hypothetical protein